VLIESGAKSAAPVSGTGEQASGQGIVLKAEKSTVFTQGKNVHLSGSSNVKIETFGSDYYSGGTLLVRARQIGVSADRNMLFESNKAAWLSLGPRHAVLAGGTAGIAGGRSAFVSRGTEFMQPVKWLAADFSPYDLQAPTVFGFSHRYSNTDWLAPYGPSVRTDVKFTYRSAAEYGTTRGSEVGAGTFYVYEPSWAVMARGGSDMARGGVDYWTETGREIDGTLRWPGYDKWSGTYVTLADGEKNVYTATAVAKKRAVQAPHSGTLVAGSMDEYAVKKH
jgi:hypothetical protein